MLQWRKWEYFKKFQDDSIVPKRHSTGADGHDLHSIEGGKIESYGTYP